MSSKRNMKPLALAVGTALCGSIIALSSVQAETNPFGMADLSSGYMVAGMKEGKCGEGKCGGSMKGKEGKCGMKMMDADGDGKITKEEFMSGHEKMFSMKDKNGDGVIDASERKMMMGKCGEGKCGGMKGKEGKCGGDMKGKEGKCGEGKCGGKK